MTYDCTELVTEFQEIINIEAKDPNVKDYKFEIPMTYDSEIDSQHRFNCIYDLETGKPISKKMM
jgi:hypothetical protein